MAIPGTPVATYRLQFNWEFTFAQAEALVPYLHQLGVTHLYASPLFAARPGSSHGYDGTDPTRLNPELGTAQDFEALTRALDHHGIGLLLDIVPNHLAASPLNPWWADVLENGPASPYAAFFDIDWHPPGGVIEHQVVLSVLGKPYHETVEGGELSLGLDDGGFHIKYYDTRLPLEVKSCGLLLSHLMHEAGERFGQNTSAFSSLQDLTRKIESLPPYYATSQAEIPARHQATQQIKQDLAALLLDSRELKDLLEERLKVWSGQEDQPETVNLLDSLLSRQPYRLTFWETGRHIINYRRFFDISDLVGVRVEVPQVLEATHSLVLKLAAEGKVSGVRIDHIDGLYDPAAYLHRLQERVKDAAGRSDSTAQFYVVVEKILSGGETLPIDWPVAGTTGYDFLNALNGVFVDREGFQALVSLYQQFTGLAASFADVVYANKKMVIEQLFGGEARNLGHYLSRLALGDRYACDLPRAELARALVEVSACLPVYRTYIRQEQTSDADRRYVEKAVAEAVARTPSLDTRAVDFFRRVLLGPYPASPVPEAHQARWEFVARWQQFTGPAMAKGFEDTSLYLYHPLVSLNEVGGEPTSEHLSVEAFHQHNTARQSRWPCALNATATHDTKRGEDLRARVNVLSEMPEEWARCLRRWQRWNRPRKQMAVGESWPEANTETLLYQTLIGAWPLDDKEVPQFKERLQQYMVKAAREAKTHTNWLAPTQEYERALASFAEAVLEDSPDNRFLPDFLRLQERLSFYGALNSLSQVLLKAMSPGVPDFYRGTELWDFSLVDPDNRRPVDFARRAQLLDGLREAPSHGQQGLLRDLLRSWQDGRVKLYLTWKLLQLRQEETGLFREGEYIPLGARGQQAGHICAFARRQEDTWAVAAAPRLLTTLVRKGRFPLGRGVWGDDYLLLPPGAPQEWHNVLTGETVKSSSPGQSLPLAQLFRLFPVACLVGYAASR